MYTRNQTRVISIGDVKIGGGNPVAIQSMTNTKTENVEETVKQILALEKAGCQIIRCTVPVSYTHLVRMKRLTKPLIL